jgi:hypothetical protein
VYTPQEALEKPSVAPIWLQKTVCSSHSALEKQLKITARGLTKNCKNSKLIC